MGNTESGNEMSESETQQRRNEETQRLLDRGNVLDLNNQAAALENLPQSEARDNSILDNKLKLEQELYEKFRQEQKFIDRVAKEAGVDPKEIDTTKSLRELPEKFQSHIATMTEKVLTEVEKIQKRNGENGKSISQSPKTVEELADKIMKDDKLGNNSSKMETVLKVLNIIALLSGTLGIALNKTGIMNKFKNIGTSSIYQQGCVQYNTLTGSVRMLGMCGQVDCTSLSQQNCNTSDNPYCSWDKNTNSCINSSIQGDDCTKSCNNDNDCKIKAINQNCPKGLAVNNSDGYCYQTCTKDSDCPNDKNNNQGTCSNGICNSNYKYCNDSGVCSPDFVDGTKISFKDQVNWGMSYFSKVSGQTTQTCPIAQLYCSNCEKCAVGNSTCQNTTIVQNQSCTCSDINKDTKNDNWITYPMGQIDTLDVITMMNYLDENKEIWVTIETPLVVKIISWIGIILMILTLIWYIQYLIRHAKIKT
jgi:hypothetical protein